jgi:hypothetical protein
MAGKRSPKNPSLRQLTSPPETLSSNSRSPRYDNSNHIPDATQKDPLKALIETGREFRTRFLKALQAESCFCKLFRQRTVESSSGRELWKAFRQRTVESSSGRGRFLKAFQAENSEGGFVYELGMVSVHR